MAYRVATTHRFKKDIKRLRGQGTDLHPLQTTVELLASGLPMPPEYKDHALKGARKHFRECHIGPDWLLEYCKDGDKLVLLLISTGTHRDVLGIE